MILFSHPAADRRVRHTASALSRAGVLGEFWTYAHSHDAFSLRRIPPASLSQGAADGWTADERSDRGDCHDISRCLDCEMSARVGSEQFSGVYAFEGAADATFRAASERGVRKIYDLPTGSAHTGHPFLLEEATLEPEWASTLWHSTGAVQTARLQSELNQADLVIVTSTFALSVVESTANLPGAIAVIPPGTSIPPSRTAGRPDPVTASAGLRVLFAGTLGQRSGLSYLFKACRSLGKSVQLTVVGLPPPTSCAALRNELARVRWIASSSADVIRHEMANHDVFLFPSVFEDGSPMLLDALSSSLPVIATAHSAAPDLIRDGSEGFIVPIRSPEIIAEKLELLLSAPDLRLEMGRRARERASLRTWETFETTMAASITAALGLK